MKHLKSLISELEKRASSDQSFDEIVEDWKSQGVAEDADDFIKQGFKAIKLYEHLMRPLHGHPELREPHSQMKHIYECLIEAKNHTENAIMEWQKFKSIL